MDQLPRQGQPPQKEQVVEGWRTPPPGTIRIICDASWSSQIGMGGIGVITRDSRGEVVGGLNRRLRGVDSLEASTVLEGTRLTVEQGWKTVEIESDSSVIINQINGGISHWWTRALNMNISTTARRIDHVTWKAILRTTNEYG